MPFNEFPWFRTATIEQTMTVEWPTSDPLHWPLLDSDLSVLSIRNPAAFPLIARPASEPGDERRTHTGLCQGTL